MRAQLTLRAVSKSYPGRALLRSVSAVVRPGERVGIVGENGAGKSTLLRIISGQQRSDSGAVTVLADDGIGYLAQVLDLPTNATVQDAMDAALADLRMLEEQLRAEEQRLSSGAGDLNRYGDLLTRFEARGGYTAQARVQEAMAALGLPRLRAERPLGTLSGGERARLALATVLAADPELLLLDEPTNHLDESAVEWLQDRLRRHRGTVVVVTHDREFLERVADALLEVDADTGLVVRHGNGYSGYLRETRAARVRREQRYHRWRHEVSWWSEWAESTAHRVAPGRAIPDHNKCKYNGDGRRVQEAISTRTRSARERLRRLHAAPVAAPPRPLTFTPPLPATDTATAADSEPLVQLHGVAHESRLTVDDLTIGRHERIRVAGPNGAGKSTLLRVLAGELWPTRGTVQRTGRVAHLAQEVAVPRTGTVLTVFADGLPGTAAQHRDQLLEFGLFRPRDLGLDAVALSAGQWRRLQLAKLLSKPVDLLLLDEPTNHFSPALVEDLETALATFMGAVVVVSHDRRFVSRFAGRTVDVSSGGRVRIARTTA